MTKISDLKGKSQDLTLYGSPECRQRTDCLVGLRGRLRPQVQEVQAGRHRAALRGARQGPGRRVDHLHVGRAALGNPDKDTLLEDDKGIFPAGQPDLGRPTRPRSTRPARTFRRRSRRSRRGLTLPVMRELNARVDIDKQDAGRRGHAVPEGVRLHPVADVTSGVAEGRGVSLRPSGYTAAPIDRPNPFVNRVAPRLRLRGTLTSRGSGGPEGVQPPGANRNQLVRSAALGASPPANSVGRREL